MSVVAWQPVYEVNGKLVSRQRHMLALIFRQTSVDCNNCSAPSSPIEQLRARHRCSYALEFLGSHQTSAVVKRFYAALAAGEQYADDAWAGFMAHHGGGDGGGGGARGDADGDGDVSQPGASPGSICYKCGACIGQGC